MIVDNPDIILYNHDYYKPTISKALDITRDYVIKHKLILTGGTAIDLALRTKGTNIYDDDELPDYDIISDYSLDHAQELAKILCEHGFPDINVINAFHTTTVRVRFKRTPLLDATFVPNNVIVKIPFMDVDIIDTKKINRKFRIIHPNYQKIDQHLSMSRLMEETGVSLNIFNRLEKDYQRNQLLNDYFKFPNPSIKFDITECSIPIKLIECDETYIKYLNEPVDNLRNLKEDSMYIANNNICCTGFTQYALMYHEYKKNVNVVNKEIINPHQKIKGDKFIFDIPTNAPLAFLNCNDDIDNLCDSFKKSFGKTNIRKYNKLLDLKNISYELQYDLFDFEFIDTYNVRVNCNHISLANYNILIANYNRLLAYFIYNYFLYDDNKFNNNIFIKYYHSLILMIHEMQQMPLKHNSLFLPSINIYGERSMPDAYFTILDRILHPNEKQLRPSNIYTNYPNCETDKPFNFKEADYYQVDGLLNNKISHSNRSDLIKKRDQL